MAHLHQGPVCQVHALARAQGRLVDPDGGGGGLPSATGGGCRGGVFRHPQLEAPATEGVQDDARWSVLGGAAHYHIRQGVHPPGPEAHTQLLHKVLKVRAVQLGETCAHARTHMCTFIHVMCVLTYLHTHEHEPPLTNCNTATKREEGDRRRGEEETRGQPQ